MPQPIVIVMVKAPRAGEVKTRLVPPLSESEAASLAACFAQDTVLNAQHVVSNVLVAYAPSDARVDLEAILPSDLLWCEQAGVNLGERLDSVAEHVFSLGFSPFVILGADSPTLPAVLIQEALNVLASADADITLGTDRRRRLLPCRTAQSGPRSLSEHRLEHGVGIPTNCGERRKTKTPAAHAPVLV